MIATVWGEKGVRFCAFLEACRMLGNGKISGSTTERILHHWDDIG
jgi:hypothetical protein